MSRVTGLCVLPSRGTSGFWGQKARLFASYVTLGKSLNVSELWFPHLKNTDSNNTDLTGLVRCLNKRYLL